jgi:hypothetical protein
MTSKEQPTDQNKRPRPSYEKGELRDKSIEEKMDPNFRREGLRRLIKKAAKGNTA